MVISYSVKRTLHSMIQLKFPGNLLWVSKKYLGFPGASDSKKSCSAENLGLTPGLGRSPRGQHGTATHSSVLAWRIPWTEEPGGLQSMGHKESDMSEQLTLSLHREHSDQTFSEIITLSSYKFLLVMNSTFILHMWMSIRKPVSLLYQKCLKRDH